MTREEIKEKQEAIQAEVKKVAKEIIKDGMSNLEKEIAINDYLCMSAEYDNAALENAEKNDFKYVDESFHDSFNAYGILLKKKGVCASYAASFKLLAVSYTHLDVYKRQALSYALHLHSPALPALRSFGYFPCPPFDRRLLPTGSPSCGCGRECRFSEQSWPGHNLSLIHI